MYPGLKSDLVKMLSQNRALWVLQIFPNVAVEVDCPEMIDLFRQYELSKLQILNLCVTAQIFTKRIGCLEFKGRMARFKNSQSLSYEKPHPFY